MRSLRTSMLSRSANQMVEPIKSRQAHLLAASPMLVPPTVRIHAGEPQEKHLSEHAPCCIFSRQKLALFPLRAQPLGLL